MINLKLVIKMVLYHALVCWTEKQFMLEFYYVINLQCTMPYTEYKLARARAMLVAVRPGWAVTRQAAATAFARVQG